MKIYKYILIVSGVVVLALVVWAIIAWRNNPESIPAPSGTATVESQANTNSAENAENLAPPDLKIDSSDRLKASVCLPEPRDFYNHVHCLPPIP